MINTKFYKILVTLSKDEFIRFEFFMKYMVKARPKCLLLYTIIKKAHKRSKYDWAEVKLDKSKVYFDLYQKKMKDTSSLRELSSEFYKHLKKYCAYLQFIDDEDMYFLKYLNKNEVHDVFEKEFERIKKENNKILGTDILKKNMELTEFYENYKIKKMISDPTDLNQLMKEFTTYSNLKNLQLYNVALQNVFARNFKIDPAFKAINTKILNQTEFDANVQILYKLYGESIYMLEFQDESKYGVVKNMIYDCSDTISNYDAYFVLNSLISFCNQQIRKKSPKESLFYREELQLHYFYMYNSELLNDGNYVPAQHIKNICTLAVLRINESGRLHLDDNEVKTIIENAKEKTLPRFRESTYHFNMGTFYFFQGEYDKAIEAFETKKSYANRYFVYTAKLYLLRCYFITNADDKYEKMITAFRTSLGRGKFLSKEEKTSYSNSLKAFVQLNKIKTDIAFTYRFDPSSNIEKLKLFLSENSVRGSLWFLEQIEKFSL